MHLIYIWYTASECTPCCSAIFHDPKSCTGNMILANSTIFALSLCIHKWFVSWFWTDNNCCVQCQLRFQLRFHIFLHDMIFWIYLWCFWHHYCTKNSTYVSILHSDVRTLLIISKILVILPSFMIQQKIWLLQLPWSDNLWFIFLREQVARQ